LKGLDVPQDHKQAANFFKASADLDDPKGLWSYGMALSNGLNGDKNLPEAMKYFKMSADLGNSGGLIRYGIALVEGYNGDSNFSEAMKYFKKSADLGNSKGIFHYGVALQEGYNAENIKHPISRRTCGKSKLCFLPGENREDSSSSINNRPINEGVDSGGQTDKPGGALSLKYPANACPWKTRR
jgi:TPR repeat protein